ncbi:tetratricopeptide repeat protein [Corallococcus sp. CA053C]|uniref:tetratricopeptide repeat protein n=1 Tax=Corallococcus sp. CA053C TaxID=2316732 RepID=UPI000EA1C752|nr:tetratricopeptide repeat protein [Corallococcus sp. CA053C]RKH14405.1 tetratricopeptide repeat protein [Corallococcus sp. CA053C]
MWTGLLLLVALTAGEPLEDARQAFAAGRYAEAEQQALQAAPSGAALYLVGLARFRTGRPAEALEALDAAGQAPDAPEPDGWNFNRGACLYALGRFEEAEQAFAQVRAEAPLARVAWANAGFAAFDAGSPERAAQWAERAAAGASAEEAPLVEELRALLTPAPTVNEGDEAYRQGLAAFDAGRFDEARAHFLRAATLTPDSGRARLMAGAAAYRLGARAEAHEDLTSALTLPLTPLDRRTAHQYLDLLSFGLRLTGPGGWATASVGPGFDSNVLQVGIAARDVSGATTDLDTASAFAEANVGLTARFRLSDGLFATLSYGGTQRAYALSSVQDYSLQLHRATAAVEWEAARRVRMGLLAGGDLFFTGLEDFRGLQAAVNAGAWLAWDETEHTSTRLDLGFSGKDGLGEEFAYLTGPRLEATLSQEGRLRSGSFTAWYRYRQDRIGTLVQAITPTEATVASQAYVIPFGFMSHAVGGSGRWQPLPWLTASVDAEVEWRRYLEDSSLRVETTDGATETWNARRREDVRFSLGPSLSARLSEHFRLSARYELLVNRSNIDMRLTDEDTAACEGAERLCHVYDYTNGIYEKHGVMLQLEAVW